jgi:hypothetical protein
MVGQWNFGSTMPNYGGGGGGGEKYWLCGGDSG